MSTYQMRYVTRKSAARALDRNIRTVDHHLRKKNLRGRKVGRKVLIEWRSVIELGERLGIERDWDRYTVTMSSTARPAVTASHPRKITSEEEQFSDLDQRVRFLEERVGKRATGFPRPVLIGVQENIYRIVRHGGEGVRERDVREKVLNFIEMVDAKTCKICASDSTLHGLPQLLLHAGDLVYRTSEDGAERARALTACRNLRILVLEASPAKPIVQCTFPLYKDLSPIDCLIIAMKARS